MLKFHRTSIIFVAITLSATASIQASKPFITSSAQVPDWPTSDTLVSVPAKDELIQRLQAKGPRYLPLTKKAWFLDAICGKEIAESTIATLVAAVTLECRPKYMKLFPGLSPKNAMIQAPSPKKFLKLACPGQGSQKQA